MKSLALILAVALSTMVSFYVGSTYSHARSTVHDNLCLTDRLNAHTLQSNLSSWTRADVKQFGVRVYERSRRQSLTYITQLRAVAPCDIDFKLPPDITKGG